MRIRLINPNTTLQFTLSLQQTAEHFAASGTIVDATNAQQGTPSVESHFEEAVAAIGVIEQIVAGDRDGIDGYVICCFGDTGLAAAREVSDAPVVGMTEAAFFAASLLGATFSVITLPPRTRIHSERVLRETGMAGRCARVRAIDVPVLDLADEDARIEQALLEEARCALVEDQSEAIVLGCAGLTHLVGPLSRELGVPVIDGVMVGLKMVEGLVALGLTTSKRSSFAYPPAKGLTGPFARLLGDKGA